MSRSKKLWWVSERKRPLSEGNFRDSKVTFLVRGVADTPSYLRLRLWDGAPSEVAKIAADLNEYETLRPLHELKGG